MKLFVGSHHHQRSKSFEWNLNKKSITLWWTFAVPRFAMKSGKKIFFEEVFETKNKRNNLNSLLYIKRFFFPFAKATILKNNQDDCRVLPETWNSSCTFLKSDWRIPMKHSQSEREKTWWWEHVGTFATSKKHETVFFRRRSCENS